MPAGQGCAYRKPRGAVGVHARIPAVGETSWSSWDRSNSILILNTGCFMCILCHFIFSSNRRKLDGTEVHG